MTGPELGLAGPMAVGPGATEQPGDRAVSRGRVKPADGAGQRGYAPTTRVACPVGTLEDRGCGRDRVDPILRNESLWAVPLAGGAARPLLDPAAHNLAMPGGEIAVTPDGVLFADSHRGGNARLGQVWTT